MRAVSFLPFLPFLPFLSFLIALFAFSHSAAAQITIAIVDTDSILVSLDEYKQQNKALENYQNAFVQQLEEKTKELERKRADFLENQNNYIIEVLEEKAKEMQLLQQNLETFQRESKEKVQRKQIELITPISEKIISRIRSYAKSKGYAFVFTNNPQAGFPFLHIDETADITSEMIKLLREQ